MPEATVQGRPRPRFRTVEVSRVRWLSSHMVSVTLEGSELEGFQPTAPSQHIKIVFPRPGEERPVLPNAGQPPQAGAERPLMRTYTPRRYDPDRLELEVEFFIHGDGPASSWAARAKPGDAVAIAGPGGRFQPNPDASWYLLAADESALPALEMILESLPGSLPATTYIETAADFEELPLPATAGAHVTWLHRLPGDDAAGQLLARAVISATLPAGVGQVWAACESSVARGIRKDLLGRSLLPPESLITRGYWKRGESNHPDHDYGEE
ncbi:MAG TPA: siderophore-interacting protein [Chloroflexota bacterium]|nr:siderophore-interacting protein [Chloroflexota bacterium]